MNDGWMDRLYVMCRYVTGLLIQQTNSSGQSTLQLLHKNQAKVVSSSVMLRFYKSLNTLRICDGSLTPL